MLLHNPPTLNHLDRMTDDTGLIQHAIYALPRRDSGYTTDDNARALRLCARMWEVDQSEKMLNRVARYLSFLEFARIPGRGFHNFMSYQREWLDLEGCGDCQGQAVLALSEVCTSSLPEGFRNLARELIVDVQPGLADIRSLRAQAYVVLAWGQMKSSACEEIDELEEMAWLATKRIVESYHHSSLPQWAWFEPQMTYANAALPHALMVAAKYWPEEEFLDIAQQSFNFLNNHTTHEGMYWPIGNQDWYGHGSNKAIYDQQPLEAALTAEAAITACEVFNDERYFELFVCSANWFLGKNSLNRSLFDPVTEGCCDGLHAAGLNRNQGAESTLAYLWTQQLVAEFQTMMNANEVSVYQAK
jgi:hypothetical protein